MIYIASPYNHIDPTLVELNYTLVSQYTAKLVSQGITAISPITYGHTLLKFEKMPTSWEFWTDFCLSILVRCDELWIYQIPGWDISLGVATEIEFAKQHNISIKYIEC